MYGTRENTEQSGGADPQQANTPFICPTVAHAQLKALKPPAMQSFAYSLSECLN
jgi:hypothetical protein